jgi:hypothetical protein
MAKKVTRMTKPIRSKRIKMTASIESATKIIEKQIGLPPGSVALLLPSGRRKNGNASVQSLWDSWET